MKKNCRKIIFVVLLVFSGLLINSCDLEPKDYISVYIVNHTDATIDVYTGVGFFIFEFASVTIPAGGARAVVVERGYSVSIHKSNKPYTSRTFFMDDQWDVY